MRLTLRTLLAWIDGVLPPAEQEELGGKVEASPVAPKIVERIRAAVANPPIAAASGDGPVDDANAVAEFLDNVLPPGQLEAFERACLESQASLAEVAACHRLLAEAAKDPGLTAAVGGDERRRLIRTVAGELSREPESAHPGDAAEAASAASGEASAAAVATSGVRPKDRGRRRTTRPTDSAPERASLWAWLSAAAAVALLMALGAVLARSIWPPKPVRGIQPREVAAVASAEPRPAAEPAPEPDDASLPPPEPAPQPAAVAGVASETQEIAAADTATTPAPLVAAALPAGGGEPADQTPLPDPAATRDADNPPLTADGGTPPPGRIGAGDPVLRLVQAADEPRWRPSAPGDHFGPSEEFVVPSGCFPVLERNGLTIGLRPGTKAAVTTDPDGTPRVEIVFGRGVVWSDAAAGAAVGISAAGLRGVVALGPRQPLGIEVRLVHRPGDDPAVVSPGQDARVFATGGVEWRQTGADGSPEPEPLAAIGATQAVPPRGSLTWTSADPGRAGLQPDAGEPDWLNRGQPAGRIDHSARAALVACLERVGDDRPVEVALRELAIDRRAEHRMPAAATLALLGEYEPLVQLLCADAAASPLREAQWRSLQSETIPLALARGGNSAARLQQAFAAGGPIGRGDELFRLACGLSSEEAAGGERAAVVALLEDPHLAVRRFAQASLLPLVPDDPEAGVVYRPDRAPDLNEKGLTWWRRRLEALGARGVAAP